MSHILTSYLPSIHSVSRKKSKSSLFGYESTLILLDFIGLDNHFITEYGQVWNKQSAMRTREGFVIRGSVPLVELDGLKYPWIRLPIQRNPTWIPINLLLGWAFKPNPNANEKHFAIRCKKFVAGVYTGTDGIWHTEPDTDSTLYLKFIDQLYNTN